MANNPDFNRLLAEGLKQLKPTNRDRLRAMSNEELAGAFAQQMVELVCRVVNNFSCDIGAEKQFLLEKNKADWLKWLQSPVDGGGGDGG